MIPYCNMVGMIPERVNESLVGNSPWSKGLRCFVDSFCQGKLEESRVEGSWVGSPPNALTTQSGVWWAVDWEAAKCNLWLFDTSVNLQESLFCNRINLVILMVNLSDIQAVRQLENYKKAIGSLQDVRVIVLGTYVVDSVLVADQKVKVLEWIVEDDRLGDSAFLLVDLNSDIETLSRVWKEIFISGLNID